MENASQSPQGTDPTGDRLARLSLASLRIDESLDMETALRAVMDTSQLRPGG